MEIDEGCEISGNNPAIYKFTGKELDDEADLDWYYFGARYYDAAVGRWLSVDPLAEKYPSLSPYVYAVNNPYKYIDPDGEDIKVSQYAQKNSTFMAAYNMLNKTDLGSSLISKINQDNSIFVSVTLGNLAVDGEYGLTTWYCKSMSEAIQSTGLINLPYGPFANYYPGDIKSGQQVARVLFNLKTLSSRGMKVLAEDIYHELKAHIDLDEQRDEKNTAAEHKKYENLPEGLQGILKQLEEIYKNKDNVDEGDA